MKTEKTPYRSALPNMSLFSSDRTQRDYRAVPRENERHHRHNQNQYDTMFVSLRSSHPYAKVLFVTSSSTCVYNIYIRDDEGTVHSRDAMYVHTLSDLDSFHNTFLTAVPT